MAALGDYSCLCVKAKNTLKRICTMKRVEMEGYVNERTINGGKNFFINGVDVTMLLLVAIVGCHCSGKK